MAGVTYPTELELADSVIESLAGTTDDETGIAILQPGIDQDSSPTLQVQDDRRWKRMLTFLAALNQGRVVQDGALTIGVFPINYMVGGVEKNFTGAKLQAVPDDSVKKIYVDSAGALNIAAAWPGDPTTYLALAEVVVVSGTMSINDQRDTTLWVVPQLAGTYADTELNNLAAVTKLNVSLLPDTAQDGTIDLGASAKRFQLLYLKTGVIFKNGTFAQTLLFADPAAARNVTIPDFGAHDTLAALAATQTFTNKFATALKLNTSLIFKGASFDYTLTWVDPAAARAITLKDPGADADLVTTQGAQTLYLKNLVSPTISNFANAPHDHNDATNGGNLDQSAFGTLKLFPFFPSHLEKGTLSVGVLKWSFIAPINMAIVLARGYVVTAPTDATLIVDVRVNGSSIFASQAEMISIVSGANADVSATKKHAVTAGEVITLEVEQVGSTLAGDDLTVVLWCQAAAQPNA